MYRRVFGGRGQAYKLIARAFHHAENAGKRDGGYYCYPVYLVRNLYLVAEVIGNHVCGIDRLPAVGGYGGLFRLLRSGLGGSLRSCRSRLRAFLDLRRGAA